MHGGKQSKQLAKWAAGTTMGTPPVFVWKQHADAPTFDTEAEAGAWLRGYLMGQPEPIRSGGLCTVRQVLDVKPL
jgi:hypothetical protein